MDKVDVTASLLTARHNKTEVSDDVRKVLAETTSEELGSESESDVRIANAANALCTRHNGTPPLITESTDEFKAAATVDAFNVWMRKVSERILRENHGRKIKAPYRSLFMDGNSPEETVGKILKRFKERKKKNRRGLLRILDGK